MKDANDGQFVLGWMEGAASVLAPEAHVGEEGALFGNLVHVVRVEYPEERVGHEVFCRQSPRCSTRRSGAIADASSAYRAR